MIFEICLTDVSILKVYKTEMETNRKDLPECVVYVPVDFVGNTLIVFLFLVKYFLWFGMFSNYMMSKTVSINK